MRHINDQQIEEMAKEKHKMKKYIEACTDQNLRKDKMKQKKELKLKIRKRIKEVSTMQLESKLMEIERMKDDSTRYFAAIKEIKSKKEQKGIVVKDDTGKTAVTENEQIEIITT